jgi:hypothetical protein
LSLASSSLLSPPTANSTGQKKYKADIALEIEFSPNPDETKFRKKQPSQNLPLLLHIPQQNIQ